MIQLEHNGKRLYIANWARILNIQPDTIRARRKAGWSDAACLGFEPPPRIAHRGHMVRSAMLCDKRSTEPPEPLQVVTKTIEVIDCETVGKNAKRIRRKLGVTQEQAAKDLGYPDYPKCERGERKWTEELIDRFNRVAAGWVVSNEQTND